MTETYKKAYEAAQAGGMNETESHDFAKDREFIDRARKIRMKREADTARMAAFYTVRPVSL